MHLTKIKKYKDSCKMVSEYCIFYSLAIRNDMNFQNLKMGAKGL